MIVPGRMPAVTGPGSCGCQSSSRSSGSSVSGDDLVRRLQEDDAPADSAAAEAAPAHGAPVEEVRSAVGRGCLGSRAVGGGVVFLEPADEVVPGAGVAVRICSGGEPRRAVIVA
jgi:hypothetical protein